MHESPEKPSDGTQPSGTMPVNRLPVSSAPLRAVAPPATDSVAPEKLIAGYRLLREISRGGQAAAYQAIQESTGRRVAVKLLHSRELAGEREGSDRVAQPPSAVIQEAIPARRDCATFPSLRSTSGSA